MAELTDMIYDKITELCSKGDLKADSGEYNKAVHFYQQALDKLPEPKTDWEAATWIYAALGDAYWFMSDYETSKNCFYNACNCPDGITNPFIIFRLGQIWAECNVSEKASEYLLRAYMLDPKVFEEEDGKYYNIIKNVFIKDVL